LISGGVNKLLSILVGIASHANGTVLIDQFEDGFYFKKLPSIWKTIHKFAKENGTQLFATTHSQECLNALLPVLEANEEDFALVRASRLNNVPTLRVIDGKGFSSALSQEFELR
jgi:AAA15 family ATPase/GTPase